MAEFVGGRKQKRPVSTDSYETVLRSQNSFCNTLTSSKSLSRSHQECRGPIKELLRRPQSAFADVRKEKAVTAKMRAEQKRQLREADYWGRISTPQQDLPPFWSVRNFGQPYSVETLRNSVQKDSMQCDLILRSLKSGRRLFRKSDLRPVITREDEELSILTEKERTELTALLPVHHQIFSFRHGLDQNTESAAFTPWTASVDAELDRTAWKRDQEQTIRLATLKLVYLMQQHLQYLATKKCNEAHAPASLQRHVLSQAILKVDPKRKGMLSMAQFRHLWNRTLCLVTYTKEKIYAGGRPCQLTRPVGGLVDVSVGAASALFVKFGFDKNGFLPISVFVKALTETPSRLLGHELILNNAEKGRNGLLDEQDIALCIGEAKIMYPKCKNGVFPPSDFDSRAALRSAFAPRAHMWLEHVYGYAGSRNLSNNVFYTHNTTKEISEIVFYTGMVGVLCRKDLHDQGLPSQRFFFGHDNDIECLALHPSRRMVATGQQKAPGGSPYVCVWDVDSLCQLQRIDHGTDERSVIAVCFSGNVCAKDPEKLGGSILVTVTSDNKHTIHVWKWMNHSDCFCHAIKIPGWFYGPEKKIPTLQQHGMFYGKDAVDHREEDLDHPLLEDCQFEKVSPEDLSGMHFRHRPPENAETLQLMAELPGFNGTPPMIYGVAWNPFGPAIVTEGAEFLTYGVKHLKIWTCKTDRHWIPSPASFGPTKIQNVLSAIYVPTSDSSDSLQKVAIVTGLADGKIGLWKRQKNSSFKLVSMLQAHHPGPKITLSSGTQIHGGVRVLKLRSDLKTVISGGADGFVSSWHLDFKQSPELKPLFHSEEDTGPYRCKLLERAALRKKKILPMMRGLDAHPEKSMEFIAGTDGCDIWEVDKDPRVLIEGHRGDVYCCATHPTDPNIFATVSDAGRVFLWDARTRNIEITTCLGFPLRSVAFSEEEYSGKSITGWAPKGNKGFVLAVGGVKGHVLIMDVETLQPLKQFKDSTDGITVLKYSPEGGPQILAAASRDMRIYLYDAQKDYHLVAKCTGHSGAIEHLDWSLPSFSDDLRSGHIIQSVDTSREILYWNGKNGKQITTNQRDTCWFSYTLPLGFPVMGIWPDNADGTDINSVCRSSRGRPEQLTNSQSIVLPKTENSADGIPNCGFVVTSDDDSFVKLFNFPVLADDAPFRSYRGHSSHVMCIRIASDDRTVFSVGGYDKSVFQWKTCGINREDHERDSTVLQSLERRIAEQGRDKRSDSIRQICWGPLDQQGTDFGPVVQ